MKHPTELAREPSGNAKEVSWFRTILKNLRERSVKVGPGLRVSYRVDGTLIELAGREASASAPAAAVQFQGEWKSDVVYVENDIVIRGSDNPASASWNSSESILLNGRQAGLFIALTTVPVGTVPTEPPDGVNWETFGRAAYPIHTVKHANPTKGTTVQARADGDGASLALTGDGKASAGFTITDSAGQTGVCSADTSEIPVGLIVRFRIIDVCENGVAKKMVILASQPYTP